MIHNHKNGCVCPPKKLTQQKFWEGSKIEAAEQFQLELNADPEGAISSRERKRLGLKMSKPYMVKCDRCGVKVGLFFIRSGQYSKKLKLKDTWRDHNCAAISKYSLTLEEWEASGWKRVKITHFNLSDQNFVNLTSVDPSLNGKYKIEELKPTWLEFQCIAKAQTGDNSIIIIDGLNEKEHRLDQPIYGLLI